MKAIGKWIRHNQGMFAALLISAGLLVWTFGCESKVESLIEPGRQVTRAELDIEVKQLERQLEADLDMLRERAAAKYQKLDRDDAIKQKLYEFAALSAETGGVNPLGVVTLVGSIIGAGAVVDNRIKDKVIANRPLAATTTT